MPYITVKSGTLSNEQNEALIKRLTRDKIILALFWLFSVSFYSCSTTDMRAFIRRDASVKDYLYFQSREVAASENPKPFAREIDPCIEEMVKKMLGIDDLEKLIAKTKTQAFLVIKGNSILLEKYGKGYDESSIVTSFSVAKSFDSAMIGTLIDAGKIHSVDEPITTYLPELLERDERFSKITIRHLITMSSGILYDEGFPRDDDTETYFNPDLRNLALTKTLVYEEPAQHFLYNNYNPILLGLIIERVSGQSVSSYLSRSIWSKIGTEANASWSLDSDEDAFEKMESGINARAVDFAKFGCLYRDGGLFDGKVVVSKKWIEESLSPGNSRNDIDYYREPFGRQILIGANGNGGFYGFHWYVMNRPDAESDFFAYGNKGQFIYISPLANTVIVRFGEKYGMNGWKYIEAFYNLNTNIGAKK